jgi:molybdenum cofactor biosynthesis enzyme MoaA
MIDWLAQVGRRGISSAGYMVFPVDPDPLPFAQIAPVAQGLVLETVRQAQCCHGARLEILWFSVAGRQLCHAIDLRPFSPVARGNRLQLMLAPAILLNDEPDLPGLKTAATREGLALCGQMSSGSLHGFAYVPKRFQRHIEIIFKLLQILVGHRPYREEFDLPPPFGGLEWLQAGRTSLGNSPAAAGKTAVTARPLYDSAVYLHTAFREIISRPEVKTQVADEPSAVGQALRQQRETSNVPWIFNSLLNEIEYREGTVEMVSIPPEIHLSVTGKCNLECAFCAYAHDDARLDMVRPEQIAHLDFLRFAQVLRLHSGLGEPTMNPHLGDIVRLVSDRFPHLNTNFFTNGVVLQRRGLIDALVNRLAWLNVSLNAADVETWRAVCGADLFSRVQAGLTALRNAKLDRTSLLPLVHASIVLTAANLNDLPRMPALCRDLGIDRLTGFPYSGLGYKNRFGPEMTLEACRERYDSLYWDAIEQARQNKISIELPLPSEQKRVSFGLEVRSLYDFAGIETNQWILGRFVNHLKFRFPPGKFCNYLWRLAPIGSTSRVHANQKTTHYHYPCIGPLSSLDLSRRAPFDFPDRTGFEQLRREPIFQLLRRAQHQRGLSPPCDFCRGGADSRDPQHFPLLEGLVGDFAAMHT